LILPETSEPDVNELSTAECYSVTIEPGQSRLFHDFFEGSLNGLLPSAGSELKRPPLPAHWPELVHLVAAQNTSSAAEDSVAALAMGAGVIVTGQQVGLFGGPLYSPFKAATAIARARHCTADGKPHVAVFWLASEDHDFAEVNHVTFPAGKDLARFDYASVPAAAVPAGKVVLDDSITALVDRAAEILGPSEATEALAAAYRPGRTLAQAFADLYAKIFAALGLLIVDASGREFHRLGASVLRAGIERADEFHAALIERSHALEAGGYHAQVAVAPQSSLLFLIDDETGARVALKRIEPTAAEPGGIWQADGRSFSTADLCGILDAEPERISPAALLRPIFQDFLFSTSAQIGGPAEIAYLAQSAVLFERILGYQTPLAARFSGTLIEPAAAKLLEKHELTLEQIFAEENAGSLAQRLAARSMPIETKQRLAAAGNALDAELNELVEWMQSQDQGLGQSAETAAGKMRYQMNRLRTLAANFQLQKEGTLARHAEGIFNAIYPGGVLQEREHGGAYYFARYGLELAETLCEQAAHCKGHTALWL
jgi:bacillithiol biosynthesis cysteine-adding enzyme BshC